LAWVITINEALRSVEPAAVPPNLQGSDWTSKSGSARDRVNGVWSEFCRKPHAEPIDQLRGLSSISSVDPYSEESPPAIFAQST
jgi:hypothetical protein